jgi:hypothetical protein
MPQTITDKLVARIYGNGRGWVFSPKDFADLGSRKAIDMALLRLTERSTIRRVSRGIYDYPRYSDLLKQEMGPDIHQIAMALARKFGWRIQPSGPAALNLIGISTQVPSQYIFQSDGPDRKYQIGTIDLQFKHGSLKEAGFKNQASGVIVQAIKSLGEDQINAEVIRAIRSWLPEAARSKIRKDTKRVTGWVYAAIEKICEGNSDG